MNSHPLDQQPRLAAPLPRLTRQRTRNGRYASYQCDPATEARIAWIEAVLRERLRTMSTPSLVLRLAVAHYAAHLGEELETLGAVGDGKPPSLAHLRLSCAIRDALQGRPLGITKEEACASPVRPLGQLLEEARAKRPKLDFQEAFKRAWRHYSPEAESSSDENQP